MTFSSLISGTLPHHGKFSSRSGVAISRVIAHHWAGMFGGDTRLTNPDVGASANYFIYSDGRIFGQVPEEYRAWTSGSWDADAPSITWEMQNSSLGPDWQVTPAALNAAIALTADIAKRYGWGGVSSSRVRGHREFAATACPGPTVFPKLPWLAGQANAKYSGGTITPPKPATPSGKSIAQLADEVMAGKWGNNPERAQRLGSQYNAVQAEVNRRVGTVTKPNSGPTDIDKLARAVIRGDYGVGAARKAALGGNYDAVQARVNQIIAGNAPAPTSSSSIDSVARAVIRGDWGNNPERAAKLKAAGYNAQAVQNRVNQLIASPAAPAGKSVDQVARDIINKPNFGGWGTGADRASRLKSAGYNAQAVQDRINQILG